MLPIISRLSCLAGLLLAGTATAGGALTNASIYTMDDEQPTASAMAWDDSGRIVFVGSEEALEKRFADTEPMDAGGRAVLPGLIDAHGHVMGLGLARLRADLTGASSVEEVLQRLQAHAEKLPGDAWLVGRGWDQTLWDGGEFPTVRCGWCGWMATPAGPTARPWRKSHAICRAAGSPMAVKSTAMMKVAPAGYLLILPCGL